MTRALLVAVIVVACASCGRALELYDVGRVIQEDCEIRPDGEVCEENLPLDPTTETFGVEHDGTTTIFYFAEQAWVGQASTDDPNAFTIIKEDRQTEEPGPCTSIQRRTLDVTLEGTSLTGTLSVEDRVEGTDVCGQTPRGRRQQFILTGERTNAI